MKTIVQAMNLILRPFILGLSVFLIFYIFSIPFKVIYENVSLNMNNNQGRLYILFFVLACILVGHISLNRRLPLLNILSRSVLYLSSHIYKNFLVQAAKYFCEDNQKAPFSKVVKIDFDSNVNVLGFETNRFDGKVIVFIPNSPNIIRGFVIIVPEEKVQETKISPEDFLKFAFTSGAFTLKS